MVSLLCMTACAFGESRSNALSLNGTWDCAVGDGNEQAETAPGQAALDWKKVDLPGWLLPMTDKTAGETKCVWVRRTFSVDKKQEESLAVLRWNQITWGAVAFINGQRVGENVSTGPYQVVLPRGALREGENTIVLKVNGAAGVSRSKSGHMLIPAGFASYDTSPNGAPHISDDVWIDFADGAYLRWVLAMPDVARGVVRLRVTPVSREPMAGLTLAAEVYPVPDGAPLGRATLPAAATPDADPLKKETTYLVDVPIPDAKPWTYETPNLCRAHVTLCRGEQVLDAVDIRFGMRQITVKDGHYQLNGKNLWLRGSELVTDWKWAPGVPGHELDYLVTEAREMSMNAFRTHTQPPPAKWADICDEHGTMLLAEFPVLYNCADYKFTPEEYAVWHRNVLADAAGWMAYLWNHPSVVMWVTSNESHYDNAWEMGPYDDFVRALDPTRPTMRTGQQSPKTGTRDNTDWHPCDNITDLVEGHFYQQLLAWRGQPDSRTVTCSEYMNWFGWTPKRGWAGTDDRMATILATTQVGMEHTEALRRARFDAVLPYMYAGWTKTRMGKEWKGGFASPTSACWHSALSPVLASLNLFDPDYLTGQTVTTELYLINDSWHDAKIHIELLLTRENPEFIPEAACFDRPVAKWDHDFTLAADSVRKTPITWTLPAEEGTYWLTARTTGLPGRAVLSQRFVRAVKPPAPSTALKARTIVLLGGDHEAESWFRSHKLKTTARAAELKPAEHLVVIWNADKLAEADKANAPALLAFVETGGRIVVLGGKAWAWPALCEVLLDGGCQTSRAWAYEGVETPLLAGISRDMLTRWNGLPGTVGAGALHDKSGKNFTTGTNICWLYQPDWPVMAEVPTVTGKGSVLFAVFAWSGRLDRAQPSYDPVAERLLLGLLQ